MYLWQAQKILPTRLRICTRNQHFFAGRTEMDFLGSKPVLVSKTDRESCKVPRQVGIRVRTVVTPLDLPWRDFHVRTHVHGHGLRWTLEQTLFLPAPSPECKKPTHSSHPSVPLCSLLPLSQASIHITPLWRSFSLLRPAPPPFQGMEDSRPRTAIRNCERRDE